ncbi:unnamed protein product [Closterium sp. NIES-53]
MRAGAHTTIWISSAQRSRLLCLPPLLPHLLFPPSQVSEHASWGAHYYLDIIRSALKAVGGPPELVHVITGFGSTGSALVQSVVSEHASWGAHYYLDIIRSALKAVGGPPELVHVITGFGPTGSALVQSGVDRLIFVGSTAVGRKVLEASAVNLTPTVLELGGKDAFIVCDDADLKQVVPIALRAVFQCSGQNCIGAERLP